jgi:hypothetical protein
MTDLTNPPDPPDEPGRGHKLLVAAVTALLLGLGLSILVTLWWRRGGARAVITDLAEQGAVLLADRAVDEILGPAA